MQWLPNTTSRSANSSSQNLRLSSNHIIHGVPSAINHIDGIGWQSRFNKRRRHHHYDNSPLVIQRLVVVYSANSIRIATLAHLPCLFRKAVVASYRHRLRLPESAHLCHPSHNGPSPPFLQSTEDFTDSQTCQLKSDKICAPLSRWFERLARVLSGKLSGDHVPATLRKYLQPPKITAQFTHRKAPITTGEMRPGFVITRSGGDDDDDA